MEASTIQTTSRPPSLLRTLLILGRVSNLPTVWSNCLAGWMLSDGKDWSRFGLLCAGACLLYIGGMYLNDACDIRFDTERRSARPIPSGHIAARTVWILSAVLLLGGTAVLAFLGQTTLYAALGLLACIVAYDVVHKKTPLAPVLMAGCRFLLYIVAAAATNHWIRNKVLWCAGALALYIVALSFIARKESDRGCPQPQRSANPEDPTNPERFSASLPAAAGDSRAPKIVRLNLLILPLFIAPLISGYFASIFYHPITLLIIALAYVAWVVISLSHMVKGGPPAIGRTVSALLAGIVLVDMLAVQGGGGMMPLAFIVLFLSALTLQRTIPAT